MSIIKSLRAVKGCRILINSVWVTPCSSNAVHLQEVYFSLQFSSQSVGSNQKWHGREAQQTKASYVLETRKQKGRGGGGGCVFHVTATSDLPLSTTVRRTFSCMPNALSWPKHLPNPGDVGDILGLNHSREINVKYKWSPVLSYYKK